MKIFFFVIPSEVLSSTYRNVSVLNSLYTDIEWIQYSINCVITGLK